MSSSQGNIFLTMENLAFSMPLIIVCGSYAYFKYVPLEYGLPILGGIFVLYQIRGQIKAHRAKKLQNMDDEAMNDLALELEGDDTTSNDKAKKAKKLQQKKKAKVEQRLAAERKKNAKNKNKKKTDDDGDDDDDNLETFVKLSKKKKN